MKKILKEILRLSLIGSGLGSLLMLSSCTVGPQYQPPKVQVNQNFDELTAAASTQPSHSVGKKYSAGAMVDDVQRSAVKHVDREGRDAKLECERSGRSIAAGSCAAGHRGLG